MPVSGGPNPPPRPHCFAVQGDGWAASLLPSDNPSVPLGSFGESTKG